ncbi:rhomboid family intramembrane serine protease [Subsaximicrobium wynnwilliamsii]|uniref:Rhomboid family intramembrane serine protease n=1 Tax=Subsaximicrobium wynnwilliamsii TaxID=291179 RepID=A0A5C6ZED5_9FLAO|nr:rhomboid family intramembrane serine protease [Subsaximicrobium wynnwilliamsii]TXD82293.1 rhomboid family intramembrane serine protease [Subsaximicrobium wynnwilliamsii]TXD87931.1 rhomboid family intramembrane serine protease [Subsaximicrobium wynnwilliamsii]TXE01924.1 rhomboid family intramembrane serine protease [Subsaximicrobium wynnwilliamsii]
MEQQAQFRYSTSVILYPLIFVLSIWMVFWLQVRFFPSIKHMGIRPQEWQGLFGIFTSPFIHADIEHLFHNSLPLFILSVALFYFYRNISWKVLVYGILLSGLITWLIGRPSNHIGASGLVYVLVSFIFFKGIFARYFRLVALSLVIIFLYGSLIWYVFPVKEGMSWEGHLGGLITGLLFALIFRKSVAKPERYVWQEPDYIEDDDPFLRHFDADGNFIENLEPEKPEIEIESEAKIEETQISLKVNYIFKENPDR